MNLWAAGGYDLYWTESELHTNLMILLNIAGALALGLLVGYERSYHGRAAGMRTYGFVCMASAALTVLAAYPHEWFGGHGPTGLVVDPTRVIQGVVTGIGFLGAGVIMKEGFTISGLTTAASIWAASAIGVLVGIGFYAAAIALAVMSAGLMMWGAKLEGWLPSRPAIAVVVRFRKGFVVQESDLKRRAHAWGYTLAMGSLAITYQDQQPEWQFFAVAHGRRKGAPFSRLASELALVDGIEGFRLYPARN